MDAVVLAKWLMKRKQNFPEFDENNVGGLREVFNLPVFTEGTGTQRREIMLKSSMSRYVDETEFPIDRYFGVDLKPRLQGKALLDLGCGTGGRSVVWYERYQLQHVSGIEIDPVYIECAELLASLRFVDADYKVGFGEAIPYPDESFDSILSFDVFEHVIDVAATLRECHRVLKTDGELLVVFPTYYQPMEHHLGLVSKVPGLQLLFSGETLVRAYVEILDERGDEANWYRRRSAELKSHERGHTINGTSYREFRKLVSEGPWAIQFVSHLPIGSVGRSLKRESIRRVFKIIFSPLTYIPFVQEVFLHRVAMIIRKDEKIPKSRLN